MAVGIAFGRHAHRDVAVGAERGVLLQQRAVLVSAHRTELVVVVSGRLVARATLAHAEKGGCAGQSGPKEVARRERALEEVARNVCIGGAGGLDSEGRLAKRLDLKRAAGDAFAVPAALGRKRGIINQPHLHVVVALGRTTRRAPCGVEAAQIGGGEPLIEHDLVTRIVHDQAQRVGDGLPVAVGAAAQDAFDMHRIARLVESAVGEDGAGARDRFGAPAALNPKAIRPNPAAVLAAGEGEIALVRHNRKQIRDAFIVVGEQLRPARELGASVGTGGAGPQHAVVATADFDCGIGNGLRLIERGHEQQALVRTKLSGEAQVGVLCQPAVGVGAVCGPVVVQLPPHDALSARQKGVEAKRCGAAFGARFVERPCALNRHRVLRFLTIRAVVRLICRHNLIACDDFGPNASFRHIHIAHRQRPFLVGFDEHRPVGHL